MSKGNDGQVDMVNHAVQLAWRIRGAIKNLKHDPELARLDRVLVKLLEEYYGNQNSLSTET